MDVCRSLGISEATIDIWKKKFSDLGASEVRRLHQVEEGNARLLLGRSLRRGLSGGISMQRNYARHGFQLVEVVRPLLHHLPALRKVSSSVVRTPIRVSHSMGELMFNQIRANSQYFIENCSGHGTKAMPAHFILGYTHAAHRCKDGVIAHWPCVAAGTRKDEARIAGKAM